MLNVFCDNREKNALKTVVSIYFSYFPGDDNMANSEYEYSNTDDEFCILEDDPGVGLIVCFINF